MPSLNELSGTEVREKILSQEITSEEVVTACFERIEKIENKIKAFTKLYKEEALNEARKIDKLIKTGKKSRKSCGNPISCKRFNLR
jgi:aspartyl-tRNA(Asn)/glutamyl-tRNA(Gln) amidotransferase subunit A